VRTGSRGEIVTDARQRTGSPRIWAAGDVTGGPPYVYTAAAQGSAAAANALFHAERTLDYATLPRVTFHQAGDRLGRSHRGGAGPVPGGVRLPRAALGAVPRAIVNRDARGLVKLVAEAATGLIRGVHAVADGAGELITAGVYAIRSGMTVDDPAMVTVAYPFSGAPTRQQVELDGFPAVHAMCAIDALGIPVMAGRDGRITATDPPRRNPGHRLGPGRSVAVDP
jgi:mercuric reductase